MWCVCGAWESPLSNHSDQKVPNDSPPLPDFSRGLHFDAGGALLPVITQDVADDRVVMMAWMNEEAWRETIATGYAVYFSRSRGSLWRKGETSGHQQRLVEARVDCDGDAILLRVQQTGAACHEGFHSCFFRVVDRDGSVRVTDERLVDPDQVYGKNQ